MATISITIADSDLQRVVTDICGLFTYQATIPSGVVGVPDTPNPETPGQFAKRMVATQVKTWCKTYEAQQAAVTAAAGADGVSVA